MEHFPTAIAIESLFRDAYTILEAIHDTADNIDQSISGAIVHCHRSIQMLERIHRDQIRANNPDVEQDIYGLRRSLDRFIASCNALTYMGRQVAPTFESSMACMMVARPAKKSKQIREMQEEFWDHQRLLSLALANAVLLVVHHGPNPSCMR